MNRDIEKVLKKLEYGVYIVTMGRGQTGNAFTASWLTQVSSEPPLIALAVKNKHQSSRLITEAGVFAVNLISEGQKEFAKTFYGPAESGYKKLDGITLTDAPATGSPILNGAAGYLDCKVINRLEVGNHILFIAEVSAAAINSDNNILTSTNSGLHYAG
jgi:flavin reductase (DIM6/NTAB) family NADH-FMN oxidoreductase RutF